MGKSQMRKIEVTNPSQNEYTHGTFTLESVLLPCSALLSFALLCSALLYFTLLCSTLLYFTLLYSALLYVVLWLYRVQRIEDEVGV